MQDLCEHQMVTDHVPCRHLIGVRVAERKVCLFRWAQCSDVTDVKVLRDIESSYKRFAAD